MIKGLIKLISIFFIIIVVTIFYLSFIGIKTKSLNNKIKSEILKINKKINLELKSVKLLLDPLNLTINIKTFEPKMFIEDKSLELEFIKTNISLRSFLNNKFSIANLKISTKTNEVKDLVLAVRSFKNSTNLYILSSIIKDGVIIGDVDLNFDDNGKIKNDYEVKGFIKNGKLKILKKNSINDLNFIFNLKDQEYQIKDLRGVYNKIELSSDSINIKKKEQEFLIEGELSSEKDNINTKVFNNLFGGDLLDANIETINFASNNKYTFSLNRQFKINDFKLKSNVNLYQLVYKKNLNNLKEYIPNINESIELKDHVLLIDYEKNKMDIAGEGKIILKDKTDILKYKIKKKNDQYNFDTKIYINENPILLNSILYKKKKDVKSLIKLEGTYKKNNKVKFNIISLKENKNIFLIKNLNLNDEFKILNFDYLSLNFLNKYKVKNQIEILKKDKRYKIEGKSFDFSKIINEIVNEKKEKSSSIFSNLNSSFDIQIDKTYLDKNVFVNNLNGFIDYKKNKINKLDLDAAFPSNKKLSLTINTNEKNEKITTLYSNYPKPLINQYKFIKGFEEGVLDFYSIKKNNISNSILTIDNFKVQEVPVLAKLLTLASLQGIADLLTGEGIRFTDLEMKFSNEKKTMKIEELYAIGPAISILMEGYIESENLVSLRGTLVPATTINRSIASIPLIGKILVGEKTGEGIFGVSFKIKGQQKDLKTTVNPIKTLTPRFITRTLEKLKKD